MTLSRSLAGEPDWTVRGLPLPAELISMLESGRWVHPGPALHDLMPWFVDPLMFMADLRAGCTDRD